MFLELLYVELGHLVAVRNAALRELGHDARHHAGDCLVQLGVEYYECVLLAAAIAAVHNCPQFVNLKLQLYYEVQNHSAVAAVLHVA